MWVVWFLRRADLSANLEFNASSNSIVGKQSTKSAASTALNCASRDARTVLTQLPAAFEHFNEVHPHSSLRMKSPCEFRRQRVEQSRHAQPDQPTLHCV
ncbi:integrase core domain-containing protein [Hydrogenophaga sp.]|uniref:integrase core domain-containing protein n=1 Tax=Hydrogenophaga sp. TaxID=1904254 RepID=UPI003AF71714